MSSEPRGAGGSPAGTAGTAGTVGAAGAVGTACATAGTACTAAGATGHDTGPPVAGVGGTAPATAAAPGPRLPQLRMQFRAFAALEAVRLAPGYTLATLAERTPSEWIAVLNATGQLGAWDRARAERCLNDPRPVVPEGTCLVMHRGHAVATACTVLPTPAEPRAEVGWVAVDPAHQGSGLGLQVCAAVLWYARRHGWTAAILSTDDWRLPAIKTYLKLGFEPEITHHSHPARWQEVRRLLAPPAAAAPPSPPLQPSQATHGGAT